MTFKKFIPNIFAILGSVAVVSMLLAFTRHELNLPGSWVQMYNSGYGWYVLWQAGSLVLLAVFSVLYLAFCDIKALELYSEDFMVNTDAEDSYRADIFLLVVRVILISFTCYLAMQYLLGHSLRDMLFAGLGPEPTQAGLRHVEELLESWPRYHLIWSMFKGLVLFFTWGYCFMTISKIALRLRKKTILETLNIFKFLRHYISKPIGQRIAVLIAAVVLLIPVVGIIIAPHMEVVGLSVLWIAYLGLCMLDYVALYLMRLSDEHKESLKRVRETESFKSNLIGGLSHDIRTPVTSITTHADFLMGQPLPADEADSVEVIRRNAGRLKAQCDRILEVYRASSATLLLNMEEICLVDFTSQVIEEFAAELGARGLTIVLEKPDGPALISADRQELDRVLCNLLSNVERYSLPGSRVFIKIVASRFWYTLTITNLSAKPIKVPAAELAQKFTRSSSHPDSMGQGLYIASNLTSKMGSFNLSTDGDLFKVKMLFNPSKSTFLSQQSTSDTDIQLWGADTEADSILLSNRGKKVIYRYPAKDGRALTKEAAKSFFLKKILAPFAKRLKPKEAEPTTDLAQAVGEAIKAHSQVFGDKGLTFVVQKPEGEQKVLAAAEDLRAMLDILLTNIHIHAAPSTRVFVVMPKAEKGPNKGPDLAIHAALQYPIAESHCLARKLLHSIIPEVSEAASHAESLIASMGGAVTISTSCDTFLIKLAFPQRGTRPAPGL